MNKFNILPKLKNNSIQHRSFVHIQHKNTKCELLPLKNYCSLHREHVHNLSSSSGVYFKNSSGRTVRSST